MELLFSFCTAFVHQREIEREMLLDPLNVIDFKQSTKKVKQHIKTNTK